MNENELNQLKMSYKILMDEYRRTNDRDCGETASKLNNLIIKYMKYKEFKNSNLTPNVK